MLRGWFIDFCISVGLLGWMAVALAHRLNLEEEQHEYLAKAGLVLARHLTITPEAAELRILVRDVGLGASGSVIVPAPLPGSPSKSALLEYL